MRNEYKYIFIGAGVSTTFAVMKMLDNGIDGSDILIIDKGNDPHNRKPDEVMCGFLGAGGFSDGKILYSFTQGGELVKYTGQMRAMGLVDEVKHYIRKFHPKPDDIKITGIADEPDYIRNSGLVMKQNECEHIGTDYLKEMGIDIYEYFRVNNVQMKFKYEVTDTDFFNNLVYVKRDDDKFSVVRYKHLIIGTGKSGMDFINKLINKYKLSNITKAAQIGVRFESDYKYFEKLAVKFHDFKLHKRYSEWISCRTFCVNNKAAYVAIEDVNGMKSFNGHGYKDESKINNLTNFGILFEVKGIANPLEFTQNLVKKCQYNGKGLYYTPGDRKPNVDAVRCSHEDLYNLYGDLARDIEDFIMRLNFMFGFGKDYVLYLPEVKLLTNEIVVNKEDLSLPDYKNVHIMGDALSARGIFISACHGLYLSDTFIRYIM